MKQSDYDRLVRAQTGTAKKVLAAVPIQEQWSTNAILNEIRRTGANIEYPVLQGCLRSLCETGLVQETGEGVWRQVQVKPRIVRKTEEGTMQASPTLVEAVVDLSPTERLARLASDLRGVATKLGEFADSMDNAVLAVEEMNESLRREFADLEGLRDTLRRFVK